MPGINLTPPILSPKDLKRFWSFLDKAPGHGPMGNCWKWTGAPGSQNYGNFQAQGRNYRPNRLSFFLHNGIWSAMLICHSCDWRPCINPDHLWEGTHADNSRDASAKGRLGCGPRHWSALKPERYARGANHGRHTHPDRTARGEKAGMAILTAPQVLEIRSIYATGTTSYTKLAVRYGVSVVLH